MKSFFCLVFPLMLTLAGCGDLEWFPEASTQPQQFSFAPQTNVDPNTTVASETVTITGNTQAAAITVTNGEYAIGGAGGSGVFTSEPGSISAGQTVTVRHTSAAGNDASVSSVLSIAGVNAAFTSTTKPGIAVTWVPSDPTGTLTFSTPPSFTEGERDQTSVLVDISFELHNASTTESFYAEVAFVARDAAGVVVYTGSEQSPFAYAPGETSSFPPLITIDLATYARIAKWEVISIERI